METLTIEGTWEEIIQEAKSFVGRKVRITVLDDEPLKKKNEKMLSVLQKISERSQNMEVSSDAETIEIIREARSGGMFSDDFDG